MKTLLPGVLCVALAICAVWLARKCFPESEPPRPVVAAKAAPRSPSKVQVTVAALNRTITPGALPAGVTRIDGRWEYAFAREHPEYLELAAAMNEEDIAVYYAPLFRMLRLSPEHRTVLMRAMVETRLASIVGRSGNPDDPFADGRNIFALRGEIEAQLKKSLPADAFETYRWYDRVPPVARSNILEIGEQLASIGQALNPEQERAIWGVLQSAFNTPADMPLMGEFYESGILDDALLQRMAPFLTADQMRLTRATVRERSTQRSLGIRQSPARMIY